MLLTIDRRLCSFLVLQLVSEAWAIIEDNDWTSSTKNPSTDSVSICPPGMGMSINFPFLEWCYGVAEAPMRQGGGYDSSYEKSVQVCSATFGGSVPSINSFDENQALLAILYGPNYGYIVCWIGLECTGDRTWYWLNGEPWARYTNFDNNAQENSNTCKAEKDIRFELELTGRWNIFNSSVAKKSSQYVICTKRPEAFNPSEYPDYTIQHESCNDGWVLIDGMCYYFDYESQRGWNWTQSNSDCEHMDATLPAILYQNQNARLWWEIGSVYTWYQKKFWLGLACGDNGNFTWIDGSPYSYNNLTGEDSECAQPDNGYCYDHDGEKWYPRDKSEEAPMLVCSRSATRGIATTAEFTTEPNDRDLSTATQMTSTLTITTITTPHEKEPIWMYVLIGISVFLILLLCIFIFFMFRRRIRSLQAKIVQGEIDSSRKMAANVSDEEAVRYHHLHRGNTKDGWEIERRFVGVDYMTKLGEGAFGSVYLGRVLAKNIPVGMGRSIAELYALTNDNEAVAVKMLHETADLEAERNFRYEIEIMKRIGYYERLVNILASVTMDEPSLLVTEYCSNGDLKSFMRERREYMLENMQDVDETKIITVKQQILFTIQIAYGLEYLSSHGFVHRDIAARNIMVDHLETCKIGDFGLCREIANEDENYQAQGGKLPLKWMSPEAIDKYHFSVASDIWSYGILLFEIVTLGGSPYVDWPATELLTRLKRGDRMSRPDHCSENMFEIMSGCWADLPADRPSFTKLRKLLAVHLEDINQDDYYLKLNAQADYYVLENNVS